LLLRQGFVFFDDLSDSLLLVAIKKTPDLAMVVPV
jgi:hypothetical protein